MKKLFRVFVRIASVPLALLAASQLYRALHNLGAARLNTPLYVSVKGPTKAKRTVVFLHGLFGSHRYWGDLESRLGAQDRLIAPDLLGFGRSPWPHAAYTSDQELEALEKTLDQVAPGPFDLVGHSMGAQIAALYAARHPDRVLTLTLMSPPVFKNEEDARRAIAHESRYGALMAFNPVVAPLICTLHEWLGPLSVPLFRVWLRELPPAVAEDAALHTWDAYHGTLTHIVIPVSLGPILAQVPTTPLLLIRGEGDPDQTSDELKSLANERRGKLIELPGGHNFVLEQGARLSRALNDFWAKH